MGKCHSLASPEHRLVKFTYIFRALKINFEIPFQWTLMGYMIEGGGNPTMSKAKVWLNEYPDATHQLLTLLTNVIVDYFEMQVKAGAQMLQVFESNAEYIDKEQFLNITIPYVRRIRDELRKRLTDQSIDPVPMVLFAKGGGHSLREQADCGYEVIGLDYNVDPIEARAAAGPNVTLQGNLNPADMYKTPDEIKAMVEDMVRKFGKNRYIANLGHGITPQTPIESMTVLVDTVHSVSNQLN